MDYDKRFVLIILVLIVLVVALVVFALTTSYTSSVWLSGASIGGVGATYYQVYQELVDCLEFYESGGNIEAVGLAGEIGNMQFMPSTFKAYCVNRYRYRDDIKDAEIQKECSAEMIHKELAYHWTTYKYCKS